MLHTNVLYELSAGGRLRVIAGAGGGVANIERRTRISRPEVTLPFLEELGFEPFTLPAIDIDRTSSDTALSLNAGGTIEYAWTDRLGAGADVRYVHVAASGGGLDTARVIARIRWQF